MRSAPRFPLGSCMATPGAIRTLEREGGDWRMNAAVYLARGTATGATSRARTPERTSSPCVRASAS